MWNYWKEEKDKNQKNMSALLWKRRVCVKKWNDAEPSIRITWLAPGVPSSWLPSNMCSGLVGWEKLTWPSVWLISNMASQPPGAKSGWELENCILSSLPEDRVHSKKWKSQKKIHLWVNIKIKDTKLWPVGPGYQSCIWPRTFVSSWAQRWLLYTCTDTQTLVKVNITFKVNLIRSCWYWDLPWVNHRSFCISAMVMRASGLASSNLDNKPEGKIYCEWHTFPRVFYTCTI